MLVVMNLRVASFGEMVGWFDPFFFKSSEGNKKLWNVPLEGVELENKLFVTMRGNMIWQHDESRKYEREWV